MLIAKAANGSAEVAAAMVSLTLLALARGTVLQAIPLGPFGSGYLCQPIPTAVYFVPALVAAKAARSAARFRPDDSGGVVRGLRRLRPMFPPEIAGLVVLLVGIATGVVGLRVTFGVSEPGMAAEAADLVIGLLTLAVMAGLNIWGRGADCAAVSR